MKQHITIKQAHELNSEQIDMLCIIDLLAKRYLWMGYGWKEISENMNIVSMLSALYHHEASMVISHCEGEHRVSLHRGMGGPEFIGGSLCDALYSAVIYIVDEKIKIKNGM